MHQIAFRCSIVTLAFILLLTTRGMSQYSSSQTITLDNKELVHLDFKPLIIKKDGILAQAKFNASALPFFCKVEHKIESNSKIAFRFRLGDLNYVNMLENKN